MKTPVQRRNEAMNHLDKAIKSLSKRNKDEKRMIEDIEIIKESIDETIIYKLK